MYTRRPRPAFNFKQQGEYTQKAMAQRTKTKLEQLKARVSEAMAKSAVPSAVKLALMTPMLIQGVAAATFFVSMVTLTLNGLTPAQIPAASGLSNFIRLTVASFAASAAITAYDAGTTLHLTRIAESMPSNSPAFMDAMTKLQHAGMSATQAVSTITAQVLRQAHTLSLTNIYRVAAVLVLLAIPCVWFTRRSIGNTAAPVAD